MIGAMLTELKPFLCNHFGTCGGCTCRVTPEGTAPPLYEEQLRENLGATGWSLTAEQVARLDRASLVTPPYPYYPYWNGQFAERSPTPVPSQTHPA